MSLPTLGHAPHKEPSGSSIKQRVVRASQPYFSQQIIGPCKGCFRLIAAPWRPRGALFQIVPAS